MTDYYDPDDELDPETEESLQRLDWDLELQWMRARMSEGPDPIERTPLAEISKLWGDAWDDPGHPDWST